MNSLHTFKNTLDSMQINGFINCDELIKQCVEEFSNSKQNIRGLTTLLLRYYIIKKDTNTIKRILYEKELMRRDYLTCLEYFLYNDNSYEEIEYIYSMIKEIETKDVDLMIKSNWIELLKKFDGYMIECSYKSNFKDTSILQKYKFDVSKMRDKYVERIKNKDEFNNMLQNIDVLIDGANMGHLSGEFNFSILPKLIKKLQLMNFSPKIILHERHQLEDSLYASLKPYLIRTPTMQNDDDYMIYGMLCNNVMVLSNDQFRDHLKNMDMKTKCFVDSMRIKLQYDNIIIPKYSKCIQVIDNNIYIPCRNGFYKL